jgi:hypothetical protein
MPEAAGFLMPPEASFVPKACAFGFINMAGIPDYAAVRLTQLVWCTYPRSTSAR